MSHFPVYKPTKASDGHVSKMNKIGLLLIGAGALIVFEIHHVQCYDSLEEFQRKHNDTDPLINLFTYQFPTVYVELHRNTFLKKAAAGIAHTYYERNGKQYKTLQEIKSSHLFDMPIERLEAGIKILQKKVETNEEPKKNGYYTRLISFLQTYLGNLKKIIA
uniref:Uncharacterized protein n=1 Tax=Strigamia maritima TaxID=126957 RepID=T1INS1_STRMM